MYIGLPRDAEFTVPTTTMRPHGFRDTPPPVRPAPAVGEAAVTITKHQRHRGKLTAEETSQICATQRKIRAKSSPIAARSDRDQSAITPATRSLRAASTPTRPLQLARRLPRPKPLAPTKTLERDGACCRVTSSGFLHNFDEIDFAMACVACAPAHAGWHRQEFQTFGPTVHRASAAITRGARLWRPVLW